MAKKDKKQIVAIIFSILAAFILWIYATGDKNQEKTKEIQNIPVSIVNSEAIEEANLALVPNQDFTVNLKIRGGTLKILSVTPDSFKLKADMSLGYLKKGFNNIPVEITTMPDGIVVVDKHTFIRVELDTLREKNVEVKINVTGMPQKGFGYLQPITKPTAVVISGPERFVNMVSQVIGEIDVNGKSQDVTGSIVVKPVDVDGVAVQNVKVEPKYVDVTIPIKPAKDVPIVIKTTGSPPQNKVLKDIIPDIKTVTIIGEKSVIDRINQIQTVPFNISSIDSSSSNELLLNVPPGISIFNDMRSINVTFVLENVVGNTFNIPVDIINEEDGFVYTVNHSILAISLEGSESLINTLNVQSLKAMVDVDGMGEGEHTVTASINLPEGVRVKDSSSLKVNVNVSKKQQ